MLPSDSLETCWNSRSCKTFYFSLTAVCWRATTRGMFTRESETPSWYNIIMLSVQRMSVALCSEVVQAGVCPSILLHREPQRPNRGRSVRFLGIFSESSRNFLGTVYLIFALRTGAVLGSGRKSVMPFEYSVSREPQLPTPRAFRSFSGNFLGIFRLRAASSPLFSFSFFPPLRRSCLQARR